MQTVLRAVSLLAFSLLPSICTAAHLDCNPATPYICIASFYPGVPQVQYDVPGPVIDLSAEEVSIVFTLPVGLNPVDPGIRSVVLLNRPGGPSGPVGAPSDFLTLTAFSPELDPLAGLVQLFELFFQSEGAPGFDVNVLAVQTLGAPELTTTGEYQDVSALLNTEGVITLWVGSEAAAVSAVPEPGSWVLLASGLIGITFGKLKRRT